MRTGRTDAALARLDEAIAGQPEASNLGLIRSTVLTFAGDHAGADATLEDAFPSFGGAAGSLACVDGDGVVRGYLTPQCVLRALGASGTNA